MANDLITNPIGSRHPTDTTLTHPEFPHLIMGPDSTGTAATIQGGCLVVVGTTGTLALHTSKTRPMGVAIYSTDYNWGTTTPAIGTDFPDYIDIMICVFGPTLVCMDVSDIADAALLGTPVFESATAGCACVGAFGASATEINTDEAAHVSIGFVLDIRVGNQGTGTGAADFDLAEIFFNVLGGSGLVST